MGVIYSQDARKIVRNKLENEIEMLKFEFGRMKGMQPTKKKRHIQAYKPVHDQLQLVWASMRAAGFLSYENQYENWKG